jgi:hypothetical protein
MTKLTKAAITLLVHARKEGAAYPHASSGAGGSRHRLAVRLAKEGLLEKSAPFEITESGRKAIESIDNFGRKMPRFYLVAYQPTALEARDLVLRGTELQAFLKTSGDTVGALSFKINGLIEFWRDGEHVVDLNSIAEVYHYAERHGRSW